jgi:hypothetical protein
MINDFIGKEITLVKKDGTGVSGILYGILRDSAGVTKHYTVSDKEKGFLTIVLQDDLQESQ